MSSLVQRVGQQAADAIEAFKNAARDFTAEYTWLQNNPPPMVVAPEIMREYESLLNRSRAVGGTLQAVTKTIDAVIGAVWRGTGSDLGSLGLGAFPLIPVALIAGGTATLIAGVNAIRRFREKLKIYNELRAENLPADQAWQRAAAATATPSVFGTLGRDVIFAVAGVALVALLLRNKR